MSLYAPKPETTRTLAPQGTFMARLFSIVEVGTHQEEHDGKPKRVKKVRVSFELPTELKVFKEGEPSKPIVVGKKYTLSMGERANLRKMTEGIIGTTLIDEEAYSFDIISLIGKTCQITIKHKLNVKNEKYAYIDSVTSLMKGDECLPQFNPSFIFTLSPFNEDNFLLLPEFIRNEIMDSPEYKNRLPSDEKSALEHAKDAELDKFPDADSIDPASIDF